MDRYGLQASKLKMITTSIPQGYNRIQQPPTTIDNASKAKQNLHPSLLPILHLNLFSSTNLN
jgi:folate-dependent phosphoribosylglycinamide formyltransferase PurN